jgi:hypothetical protein
MDSKPRIVGRLFGVFGQFMTYYDGMVSRLFTVKFLMANACYMLFVFGDKSFVYDAIYIILSA